MKKQINVKVTQFSPNHFEIDSLDGIYFQSYDSVIALKPLERSPVQLFPNWDRSKTTMKHLNAWLGFNAREGLKDGRCVIAWEGKEIEG